MRNYLLDSTSSRDIRTIFLGNDDSISFEDHSRTRNCDTSVTEDFQPSHSFLRKIDSTFSFIHLHPRTMNDEAKKMEFWIYEVTGKLNLIYRFHMRIG